jgi:hypothetical protein
MGPLSKRGTAGGMRILGALLMAPNHRVERPAASRESIHFAAAAHPPR